MYTLFRQFAVGAFAAFVLAGLLVTWLDYAMEAKDHAEFGKRHHVALARMFENSLAHLYLPLLDPANAHSAEAKAGQRAHLRQAVETMLAGTDLLRLKLYDLQGQEVFVHPDTAEHIEIGAPLRVRRAIRDDVVSNVLRDDRDYDYELADRDILETYVTTSATLRSEKKRPVGVIELYTDITEEMERGQWDTLKQSVLLASVLLALYAVLLLIVRRADAMIKVRDRQRTKHLRAIERAKREAEEGSRAKSEFLTHVTHEIRTPMNTVMGTADLLLQTDLDAKQRHYVENIASSGESLLQIIDNILDLSSIKAGELVLSKRDFHTEDVIHDVQRALGSAAAAKGLILEQRCDPMLLPVRGDPDRLRQILVKLVDNAIKFSSQGRVVLDSSLESETPDHVRLRFCVADSGTGISKERQKRIFEPFAPADNAAARDRGGIGLGLAVCRYLVEEMGGDIGVESEPGRGTKICFVLPFKKLPNPP